MYTLQAMHNPIPPAYTVYTVKIQLQTEESIPSGLQIKEFKSLY